MKKILAYFLAFCITASFAGCASNEGAGNGAQTTTAAGAETTTAKNAETTAGDNEETTPADDAGDLNERITMLVQEYEGDNIVEIPFIEYEGDNAELDALNDSFTLDIQSSYEDWLDEKEEKDWIELKTYPFTSDNYLQIVMTHIVYPNYGTDGDMISFNYDRNEQRWITLEDALEMLDMSEEEIEEGVLENFTPSSDNEELSYPELCGFLIYGPSEEILLLFKFYIENSDGDVREAFYSYYPSDGSVIELGNECLFDPYDMDEMNPPLSYQRNA